LPFAVQLLRPLSPLWLRVQRLLYHIEVDLVIGPSRTQRTAHLRELAALATLVRLVSRRRLAPFLKEGEEKVVGQISTPARASDAEYVWGGVTAPFFKFSSASVLSLRRKMGTNVLECCWRSCVPSRECPLASDPSVCVIVGGGRVDKDKTKSHCDSENTLTSRSPDQVWHCHMTTVQPWFNLRQFGTKDGNPSPISVLLCYCIFTCICFCTELQEDKSEIITKRRCPQMRQFNPSPTYSANRR
jgi:hypothetical protein